MVLLLPVLLSFFLFFILLLLLPSTLFYLDYYARAIFAQRMELAPALLGPGSIIPESGVIICPSLLTSYARLTLKVRISPI